jgi:hypothetical protein
MKQDTIKMIEEAIKAFEVVKLKNYEGNECRAIIGVGVDVKQIKAALSVLQKIASGDDWFDIESAPKDDTEIYVKTCHEKDPYHLGDEVLTIYGVWCEFESHAADGVHTAIYGGGFDDRSYDEPNGANMPDWWFINGGNDGYEIPCNPTHWKHLDQAKHIQMLMERELKND